MKFNEVIQKALKADMSFRYSVCPNVIYKIDYRPHPVIMNVKTKEIAMIDGDSLLGSYWELVLPEPTLEQKRKILIKFMQAKSDKIEKELSIPFYFTEDDKKHIMSWNNKDIDGVYSAIDDDLYNQMGNFNNLNVRSCVFCVKYGCCCAPCEYKLQHGICDKEGSLASIINIAIRNKDEEEIISFAWYCKTWKDIKEKVINGQEI